MQHLSLRGRAMRLATVVLCLLLGACGSLRYYAHVAHGQASLLMHRQPLAKVVRDPATDPALARRLRLAAQARQFASAALALPDNRSYTSYVDLHRRYVAWNVFATPPYSVEALPQCFPIAGCVAYRGYFEHARAQARAAQLEAQGDDVWIGPVPAYSTLGWFADPIVSSMLRWDDDQLAGTIFHELAHQQLYLKGDTAFNESFASFVEREGLREWRRARGLPPPDLRGQAMEQGFTTLVLDLRDRLKRLYAGSGDEVALAHAKQAQIEAFRRRYAQWRDAHWPGDHRYDAWVAAPINNARLLPFGLYDRWTGAFAVLFARAERQWGAFYAAVGALAEEPQNERTRQLERLAAGAGVAP
ncbi:aminopeptidase [Frateuria sp. STR12]|uniref:aminopeptidase n=1 Tax=Frateuria hangzhouensis TaxID=2995589 RepID=UPI0022608D78|nr:aminopeptidase [Frateuria sp. STR12]MCX7513543.1 aminopeptidase [Frateuria sp. STR12]